MTRSTLGGLEVVRVHSSMRSQALAGTRARALRLGEVDPSMHYRSAYQADLWWRVHQTFAPQQQAGPLGIYEDIAAAVGADCGDAVVVAVGAGGGEKEALVVRACAATGTELRYIPIDVGLELALRSAEAAAGLDVPALPVVGDITAMNDTDAWMQQIADGRKRLITAYGITPNIDPDVLLGRLGGLIGPRGEALVSANLLTSWEDVLPQYDNGPTRQWLWQLVVDWGLADLLTPVRFEVTEVRGIPAVIAVADWIADDRIEIDNEVVPVTAGQPLRLFTSRRFTPELFTETCARAGFDVIETHLDPSGQEGVWRLQWSLPPEGSSGDDGAQDGPHDQHHD